MALLSIRCGRVSGEASVVIEGREVWVRYLALGLLSANQSGSWRKKFRGLSYRLTAGRGYARAVVLGSLRREKRRGHVKQWLWLTIEGIVQQELNDRAANFLENYMSRGDAERLGAAVAKRARRLAASKELDVDVAFDRVLAKAVDDLRVRGEKILAAREAADAYQRSRGTPRAASMFAAFAALAAGFRRGR